MPDIVHVTDSSAVNCPTGVVFSKIDFADVASPADPLTPVIVGDWVSASATSFTSSVIVAELVFELASETCIVKLKELGDVS